MIFRVYEHYNEEEYNVQECFICYDINDDFKLNPISLKTQGYYNKQCKCDGWIHKDCLDLWYIKQHKCPICRQQISKNDTNSSVITTIMIYSKEIDIRLQLILSRISKMTIYILLFYISLEYYLYYATKTHLSRVREDNFL
jgi:hypothetical protein